MGEIRQRLPRTLKVINDLDMILHKVFFCGNDIGEEVKKLSDYERILFNENDMAIASTLYSEKPESAINIAKYIMIMANLDNKKIEAKIEWK